MIITLVAVTSKNGYITNGTIGPQTWASSEDQEFFNAIKSKHTLLIMGKTTYDRAKSFIKDDGITRLIISYQARTLRSKNQNIIFTSDTPEQIIKKYSKKYNSCLLLGGGQIYGLFADASLITDAYVTIEPVTFKTGVRFFGDSPYKLPQEKLRSKKILNKQGTELHYYKGLFS